jgi:hypothetical protein
MIGGDPGRAATGIASNHLYRLVSATEREHETTEAG